jgi:hypothetical protein
MAMAGRAGSTGDGIAKALPAIAGQHSSHTAKEVRRPVTSEPPRDDLIEQLRTDRLNGP